MSLCRVAAGDQLSSTCPRGFMVGLHHKTSEGWQCPEDYVRDIVLSVLRSILEITMNNPEETK